MKKHLWIKAFIMLMVMFFHSFVLVPRANATTWEGIAGRLAFRAAAPSVIAALGSGTALVIGAVVAGGIGYLVYKSGAITALQNWLNTIYPQTAPDGWVSPYWAAYGGCTVKVFGPGNADGYQPWAAAIRNTDGSYRPGAPNVQWMASAAAALAAIGYSAGYTPQSPPLVPTDYSGQLATSQPSFPSNTVYASPGTAAAIAGGAAIVSSSTMSDSDADRFIAGSGATSVDSAGTQSGSPPSANDNTVTAGDSASIGILQQIVNYVSNLIGIKDGVEQVRTSVDNAVIGINQQTVKLDNVSIGINRMADTMDNVGVLIQNQTSILDNVGIAVNRLDNTITTSVATSSTVASRIGALKDVAATKFPFSLASSISVAAVSGASTYEFTSLPLTSSISIPIAPMAGPLHSLFDWIRQLLVWFFWAGTLLAILRKGMEM